MTLKKDASNATDLSIHNRNAIKESTNCGCYFCLRVCTGKEIEEWVDSDNDTAICPHCSIDSLLPNITDPILLEMAHVKFFIGTPK